MKIGDYFRSAPVRIVTAYTLLFAASVIILFAVVFWLMTKELDEQLRDFVKAESANLVLLYRRDGRDALIGAVDDRAVDAHKRGTAYFYLDPTGGKLAGVGAPPPSFTGWREISLVEICRKCDDNDREPYLGRGVDLDRTTLIVAKELEGKFEVQEVLLRSFAWTLGLIFVLAVFGGLILRRSALRRVDAISRATHEIVAGNMSQRLPVTGARDEFDTLAANINHMLDQIGQLMTNLQQVTSDIAHDLRTPLGRMRQRLEVARDKELTLEEHRAALDSAIGETDEILETFAALLRIAQIESRARRGRFSDVDLSEIVSTIVDAYEEVAKDHGQHLTGSTETDVRVRGDHELLTQLLANLVENAIRHCPPDTHVSVSLAREAGRPVLTVADTGPGIPAGDRDKVLRRFYRVEQSRTTSGNGLGLALVKAVADLHDAALELADNEPGLRVTLRFA